MTHLSGTEAIPLIARSVVRCTPCGCPLPSHVVEGRSPEDPWIRHRKRHCDPARVSHWLHDSLISATPWRGRISFLHPLPRSSALRASTRGLWSDDPSGALPLPAGSAGGSIRRGLVHEMAQQHRLSLLSCKTQMRHPGLRESLQEAPSLISVLVISITGISDH